MSRRRSSARALVAALVLCAACGGGRGGLAGTGVNTAQTVLDLTDAVSALQQRDAEMQGQLDSLQRTVARQDSLLARLAAAMGVALPPAPTYYAPVASPTP